MSLATLNGQIVTTCRVHLPAWGIWFAEVECSSDEVLKGAVTLVLDDVTFVGTIMTGGPSETRTRYRIAGGAGGWGRVIPANSYKNDLGVKLSTVVGDAATACGERLGTPPATRVGPSFVRAQEPASYVLDAVAPRDWYVDEAGVTQIGQRPAVAYTGQATRIAPPDTAQGRVELAPSSLLGLVPGAIVDGLEAIDVEHVLEAGGSLRTTLWGKGIAPTNRATAALQRIHAKFAAETRFHAPWEYRVVQQLGDRLDLQVVRVSSGMPDVRATLRPGLLGENVTVTPGSLCIVQFINGDRTRPIVTHGDYTTPPSHAKLMGGGAGVARLDDTVAIYAMQVTLPGPVTGVAFGSQASPAFVITAPGITGAVVPALFPWPGPPTKLEGSITSCSTELETG